MRSSNFSRILNILAVSLAIVGTAQVAYSQWVPEPIDGSGTKYQTPQNTETHAVAAFSLGPTDFKAVEVIVDKAGVKEILGIASLPAEKEHLIRQQLGYLSHLQKKVPSGDKRVTRFAAPTDAISWILQNEPNRVRVKSVATPASTQTAIEIQLQEANSAIAVIGVDSAMSENSSVELIGTSRAGLSRFLSQMRESKETAFAIER